MKILLVTSEYGEQGGGLSFACTLFYGILSESLGHDVILLSSCEEIIKTAQGGYNASLKSKISNEYRLKNDTLKLKTQELDLIIAFGGSFNGYYASRLANRLHLPLYLMLRGTDINMAKWDSQESFYLKEAGTKAIKIICLSSEMVENVLDLLPSMSHKCHIIPNIIKPIYGETHFPNLPHKVILGCSAAHINEKKGIANLLNAIKAFKDMTELDITLHIIGSIDSDLLNEYKLICNELSIDNNVVFYGYRTRQECLDIQKTWDFYIQTSVCEGFCNSVGECISAGVPVILSDTGYISETLKEKFPQIIYEDFEPSNIASTLLDIISLSEKENMYKQAFTFVAEKTSKQHVTDSWQNLLCNVSNKTKNNKRCPNILALALHEVNGEEHDHITTPETVFSDFVEKIYKNGFGICSLKDYIQKSDADRSSWIVCTFDDGYASLIDKVLPILEPKGFTATVFVNSDLIGKDNSWNWKDSKRRSHLNIDGIKKLINSGWEIGSHGHSHRNLLQLTENELEYEFSKSYKIIQSIAGNLQTYAYPYGASSPFVRKICSRYYKYAFSLHEGGSELSVDNMMIRRYSIDDIYKILSL